MCYECLSVTSINELLKHMCCIILLPIACLSLSYFYSYHMKHTIFRKTLMNVNYLSWSSLKRSPSEYKSKENLSEILSKTYKDRNPLLFVDFIQN